MEMNVEKTKVMRLSRQPSQIQIMIGQTQLENVKYFNYMGCIKMNDTTHTCEIKSWIAMAKAAFNRKMKLSTNKLDLNSRKKQ
jgi:menaquinone-dependent protoporphyrinogen IX oxidase